MVRDKTRTRSAATGKRFGSFPMRLPSARVSVCAIVACYRPDLVRLRALLLALLGQVDCVVVVDNGGLGSRAVHAMADESPPMRYDCPGANTGTAGAHNRGAAWAFAHGFSHILLLDQDGLPSARMVQSLLETEAECLHAGQRVACVGPLQLDERSGRALPFVRHAGGSVAREYPASAGEHCNPSYVISSGTLIRREAWRAIGPSDEDLFLDFTDIEWGFRAGTLGFRVIGTSRARMTHALGDQAIGFVGLKVALHSPLRHYYAFRNAISLFRRSYIAWPTRVSYVAKLLPKFFIYSLFSATPIRQAWHMLLGQRDGLIGRMGSHPLSRATKAS